jgi:hypothetical protein
MTLTSLLIYQPTNQGGFDYEMDNNDKIAVAAPGPGVGTFYHVVWFPGHFSIGPTAFASLLLRHRRDRRAAGADWNKG